MPKAKLTKYQHKAISKMVCRLMGRPYSTRALPDTVDAICKAAIRQFRKINRKAQ